MRLQKIRYFSTFYTEATFHSSNPNQMHHVRISLCVATHVRRNFLIGIPLTFWSFNQFCSVWFPPSLNNMKKIDWGSNPGCLWGQCIERSTYVLRSITRICKRAFPFRVSALPRALSRLKVWLASLKCLCMASKRPPPLPLSRSLPVWPDDNIMFFNIWPWTALKGCPKTWQFCQSRFKNLPNSE